jgi:hypothetical protein
MHEILQQENGGLPVPGFSPIIRLATGIFPNRI